MALAEPILDFLRENAARNGAPPPQHGDDLFESGALDSFALVDFVTLLETHTGIKIPDSDVIPEKFRSIAAVEAYIARRRS